MTINLLKWGDEIDLLKWGNEFENKNPDFKINGFDGTSDKNLTVSVNYKALEILLIVDFTPNIDDFFNMVCERLQKYLKAQIINLELELELNKNALKALKTRCDSVPVE